MPQQLDTSKPFSMLVVETDDYFGIACDQKGVINCRQSLNDFISENNDMQHDYHGRDHTWAASAALFAMSFPRTAIMVDNEQHAEQLLPTPPYGITTLSNVAGTMWIIPCDKDKFEEVLARGVKL